MRLLVHLGRVLAASLRFGRVSGRLSVIAVLVIGLVILLLTATAKALVPIAVYPFA